MTRRDKNFAKILRSNGKNIQFEDFIQAMQTAGFEDQRQSGTSHHIFKDTEGRMMNVQPAKDGKAKPYQVRQLQSIIQERKQNED